VLPQQGLKLPYIDILRPTLPKHRQPSLVVADCTAAREQVGLQEL